MRTLWRNKQTFFYALYQGKEEVMVNGLHTGEWVPKYSKPVKCRASISSNTGYTDIRQFGDNQAYKRTIVVNKGDLPMNEQTRLWIEVTPVIEADGSTNTPHDYIVLRKTTSLNTEAYVIHKVDVT